MAIEYWLLAWLGVTGLFITFLVQAYPDSFISVEEYVVGDDAGCVVKSWLVSERPCASWVFGKSHVMDYVVGLNLWLLLAVCGVSFFIYRRGTFDDKL